MQPCQATVYRQCLATVYIRSLDTLRDVVYRCVQGFKATFGRNFDFTVQLNCKTLQAAGRQIAGAGAKIDNIFGITQIFRR